MGTAYSSSIGTASLESVEATGAHTLAPGLLSGVCGGGRSAVEASIFLVRRASRRRRGASDGFARPARGRQGRLFFGSHCEIRAGVGVLGVLWRGCGRDWGAMDDDDVATSRRMLRALFGRTLR
jgi:hypothetical protein